MLTAKFVREHIAQVEAMLKKRQIDLRSFSDLSLHDFITLEETRIRRLQTVERLKAERNQAAKVSAQKKASGKAIDVEALKTLSQTIKHHETTLQELNHQSENFLLSLPNLLSEAVPTGTSEDDNELIKTIGEKPQFAFTPKPHYDLGAGDSPDSDRAAKISGARFSLLRGELAELARALQNFFLDENKKNGYIEMLPPTLVHTKSMIGTSQLPKFSDDVFRLGGKYDQLYLISTGEIPLTNYHANEILAESDLPIYYTAHTSCYRSEAGAAGKDTRGLIRLHEFHKTELVQFVRPDTSEFHHQRLVEHSQHLLNLLGLPYRIMLLCSGDTGFGATKCYDLEVWFPAQNAYREVSSCSNFHDFQAHRAQIRYRDKTAGIQYVHTLNGSALPIERILAAILENFQTATGEVQLPPVLQDYMKKSTLFKAS